jgi:predicted AAA+ superfamily ATPase
MINFERTVTKRFLKYMDAFPCIALLGPRQVGKTYFAKKIRDAVDRETVYLDLESDEDIAKLNNAETYLSSHQDKLVIIDEIQRNPKLFVLLRSIIDKHRENGRFLILGSASPELMIKSAESLAGRIAYLEMHPLTFKEVKKHFDYNELWLKGGFPEMLLQKDLELSLAMRNQFIQTYIERELPILGLSASPILLKNLLRMLAHNQGQLLNYSQLSNSLGRDINTVKRYMDYFEHAFLIRRLEPFHANTKKRIVKSPKVYIRDTGIYHALFDIETREELDGFIGKGNSWESFVIQEVISQISTNVQPYFYRTQDGAEIDLILVKGLKPILGLEIKTSNAPKITKGTTEAAKDLGNIPVFVITHSVDEDYKHNDLVTVTAYDRMIAILDRNKLI